MSVGPTPDFSRLARGYRALEQLAFGRDLERARFRFVSALRDCRTALILGEGDGRFLQRLLETAPRIRVSCVEGSAGMIAAAEARLTPEQRQRVVFHQVDLRTFEPKDRYDAIVTLFVLDCFSNAEVETLVARLAPAVERGGVWLFADFTLPARGWRRWRAIVWLGVLYRFFGLVTGLRVRALPDAEAALARHGFARVEDREFQHGLLRTVLLRKAEYGAA